MSQMRVTCARVFACVRDLSLLLHVRRACVVAIRIR